MALFIVRHQHDPDRCPASDPFAGAQLLNYLSRPNVTRHGVEIRGEAIVKGEHTLYMIVESVDAGRVRDFMAPFAHAGSVDIYPASTCAGVVASGGCAAPLPVFDSSVPALDPAEASEHAIDAGLLVHRAHPLNCETSIQALIGGVVMPNAHFYVRNHFHIPNIDQSSWRLLVGGLVERPLSLSMHDLHNMPSRSVVVTLECAGNGRFGLQPPVAGEPWRLGAVSTAEWTGVPLVEVLDRAGIRAGAHELVLRGAEGYERSLRLADVRDVEALLAYAMNGEPLPIQHGRPLRVVVPRWYGMASVKWLTEVEAIDHLFDGRFQAEAYHYESDGEREPVTLQRVRSMITEPAADDQLRPGELAIRGVAWSGAAPIAHVDVSVAGGPWQPAQLVGERSRHAWQWWELITSVEAAGPTTIRARATDLAGRTQPEQPPWNRMGYGNNAIHEQRVDVARFVSP